MSEACWLLTTDAWALADDTALVFVVPWLLSADVRLLCADDKLLFADDRLVAADDRLLSTEAMLLEAGVSGVVVELSARFARARRLVASGGFSE